MGWFAWFYIVLIIVVFIIIFLVIFLNKNPNKKASINNAITIFLFVFMLFALAVTASYSAIAAADTGGKDADSFNKHANTYYTWAAVFAWIGFAVAILGIIAEIYRRVSYAGTTIVVDAAGVRKQAGGTLTKICIGIIVILLLAVGILDAIGASQQQKSDNKSGYRAGVIAATTAIILFVLTLAVLISIIAKDNMDLRKAQKQRKEDKEIELKKLEETFESIQNKKQNL